MKEYQAAKINFGKDVFYISNQSEETFANDQSYLMAFAEAVEEIKRECSAEGLQIHPSCVEFIEGKSPLISEDFTEYDDTYMDYFDGYRRYIPSWSPRQYILLKDNKGNHYGIEVNCHFFYDLEMVVDEGFVDSDDDGQPYGEGLEFLNNIRDNNLIDHTKDMVFIEMNCWKCRDNIHEYLCRYAYVKNDIVKVIEEEPTILNEWKSRCEYKPIEWVDLNSLNIA